MTVRSGHAPAIRAGAGRCVGVPAFGLGLSMVGFGALAHEAGLSLTQALATTMLVWGLPGQLAFLETGAAGAHWLLVFAAVSFANMRMFPMTVSGLPVILGGRKPGPVGGFVIAHFLAVTTWVQMLADAPRLAPAARTPYFWGFVGVLYLAGILGTLIGHEAGRLLPDPLMRVAVFVAPFYLLLLVSGARRAHNRLAVLLGAVIGVALYPLLGDASPMIAGLAGGAAAMFWRAHRQRTGGPGDLPS